MLATPFNLDERDAQGRAGGGPANAPIRDAMPEQHRLFFESLSYVGFATRGPDGWPEAALLAGEPGFIAGPEPSTLRIAARGLAVVPGQPVALLGIDFATRRRNRANGEVTLVGPEGFTARVRESFGNCPNYIQRRDATPFPRTAGPLEELAGLDAPGRAMIAAADTLFVASQARPGLGGADISHRGGRPGFVRIEEDRLTIPDFDGNRYYNTLGNLLGDARAALLFVGFDTGDLLQVRGRVTIDWAARPRRWTLQIDRVRRQRAAIPLRWSAPEPSGFLDSAGDWP